MKNINQKLALGSEVTPNRFPTFVDRENYLAICALEKVGILEPSQAQIDVIETLILSGRAS